MNRTLKVARLHLNKPMSMLGVPAQILVFVLIVSAIISFALQRAGLDPNSPEYAVGARGNAGMVWSLPGFLIYYGVQAVATTLPFALALGATRRAHVLGTALANLLLSAYVAVIMLVLLWLELATDHWFFGVYALDNYALGSGDPWTLVITVFIGVFVCTSIGGAFGAVWVRYGGKGPTVVAIVLGLVLAVLILIFVPQAAEIIAATTPTMLAGVGIGIALVALLGTWACMRRTAVR
ncbi:hypothetical protein ACFPZL_07950 [Leucobacter soli]|uniref:Uncharacterized protein n=1 Tax=Leucobacter soli TaxID=2812850 RepID=A0A916JV51_9MICO|nr:hypothetical protein [Leucobacter soli]CAG7606566.1 hypothetical protein LEUCIP111803_00944 [Leucobacter soli]